MNYHNQLDPDGVEEIEEVCKAGKIAMWLITFAVVVFLLYGLLVVGKILGELFLSVGQ